MVNSILSGLLLATVEVCSSEPFAWEDIKAVLWGVGGVFIMFVVLPVVAIATVSLAIRFVRGLLDI